MTVEQIKQFLKPGWKKLFCALVLFFVTSVFVVDRINPDDNFTPLCIDGWCLPGPASDPILTYNYGFPLKLLTIEKGLFYGPYYKVHYFETIFNLLFWYLFSCLLIFIWDKIKNKNLLSRSSK